MLILNRIDQKASTIAAVIALGFAVSCATDGSSPTAPTTTQRAQLRVSVKTSGEQLDPNGYTIVVNGVPAKTIGLNDSTYITDLPFGAAMVELADIAPNCWIDGASQQRTKVPPGEGTGVNFAVECFPFSQAARGDIPFGEFELESWEFFEDAGFTTLAFDMVRSGMSGRVVLTPRADTLLDWHFREAIATSYSDDYSHVVISGHAGVNGDSLTMSVAQRSSQEYLFADLDETLHGTFRFSLVGDKLVMTRLEPVEAPEWYEWYDRPQSLLQWTRLTLSRRKN